MDNTRENSASSLNLLPCSIEYNGPAPIESHFQIAESQTLKDENKTFTAHFRGRALKGCQVKLPDSVIGITAIDKHPNRLVLNDTIQWEAIGTFDSIKIWEHDVLPNLDQFQECMDWFQIAQSVREFEIVYYVSLSYYSIKFCLPITGKFFSIFQFIWLQCWWQ